MQKIIDMRFNQKICVRLKLDFKDIVIINYLYELKKSDETTFIKIRGLEYFHINDSDFIQRYPFFNIVTKETLRKRIQKLMGKNIIYGRRHLEHNFIDTNDSLIEEILDMGTIQYRLEDFV